MREIKFKYTVVRENGFVFHKIFTIEEIELGEIRQWMKVNHIGPNTAVFRRQFAGFKDKNGVEIYEGDIVTKRRLIDMGMIGKSNTDFFYTVEWNETYAKFELRSILVGVSADMEMFIDNVAGNIHENPELLEAKL